MRRVLANAAPSPRPQAFKRAPRRAKFVCRTKGLKLESLASAFGGGGGGGEGGTGREGPAGGRRGPADPRARPLRFSLGGLAASVFHFRT